VYGEDERKRVVRCKGLCTGAVCRKTGVIEKATKEEERI